MRKTGNKPDSMKMYRNEKTQGLLRMILSIEFICQRLTFFQTFHQGV